jgi:hypothetical protein
MSRIAFYLSLVELGGASYASESLPAPAGPILDPRVPAPIPNEVRPHSRRVRQMSLLHVEQR